MNDLRDKPETGWNLLFGLSILAILVTGWFYMFGPSAKTAKEAKDREELSKLAQSSNYAQIDLGQKMESVNSKVWHSDADTLGNETLASLTTLAEKNGLILSGFRTEKPIQVASLQEAPLVVVLDGSFQKVMTFVKGLEGTDSKLAMNLLSVSVSDTGTDHVTATLGLIGFLFKEAK